MVRQRRKRLRRSGIAFAVMFVFINIIAAVHAYKFTHFSKDSAKTHDSGLSAAQKVALLFTGINNPRPANDRLPQEPYSVVHVKSIVNTECWYINTEMPAKGTVILFHGYSSCKSSLLGRAQPFLKAGYNCLLVDFMGSGGSGGTVQR